MTSKERIKKLIEQGHHQQALDSLLDLLNEKSLLHDAHFAADLLTNKINTAQLGFEPLRIGILRSFTFELIEPFLITACARTQLTPDLYFAPYNVIQQEIIDSASSLHKFKPQIVILAIRLEELSPKLANQFPCLSAEDIEKITQQVLADMQQIISGLAQHQQYQILVHNFHRPATPALGIIEGQFPHSQRLTIERINQQLRDIVQQYSNVYIVDYDKIVSRVGYEQFFDPRGWYLAKSPISPAGLAALAHEYAGFFRALTSRTKKCLVLDLDNTLWSGIIGEDGLDGISLGGDYPGNAFTEFQQAILNLYHRGVILAIASKNNQADALEVFEKHSEMILKQEHFASMQINWQDKSQNIKALATELNIGIDSMVFMDDSDFECELVRRELPQVMTVKLPSEPMHLRATLEALNCFDLLGYSAEDHQRGRQYHHQAMREKIKAQSPTLTDFYRDLKMKLLIAPPAPADLTRITQMTQKTNQFNLTTRRYQQSDIKAMLDSPSTQIYTLRYTDRFGDAGLVGLAIVKVQNHDWIIDTFLLSCRVIGRTVEQALLTYLVRRAAQCGVRQLIGEYIPTAKNSLVAEFYSQHGFETASENNSAKQFTANVDKLPDDYADYLHIEEG